MSNLDRLPNPIQEVWEWQVDAACRGMDTAVFFHPWGERGVDRDRQAVKLAFDGGGLQILRLVLA